MQSILSVIARQLGLIKSLIANKTFASLVDTDAQNAEPNDILIYANAKWTANPSSVFGMIDGGFAGSDAAYLEADSIDGGSA